MNSTGQESITILANYIIEEIKNDFAIKKMSGNLVNTIVVEKKKGEIAVRIPAQTYNMLLFQTKGVVVHNNKGSYASRLDKEGSSFISYPNGTRKGAKRVSPRNHKDFVDKAIQRAIIKWRNKIGSKIQTETR